MKPCAEAFLSASRTEVERPAGLLRRIGGTGGWILWLAACGAPPAVPPPPAAPEDDVVAYLDDVPIRRQEVLRTAAETDFPALLRRHLLRLVRDMKKKEYGIANTSEERRRRARRALADLRASRGEESVQDLLKKNGLTEEEYVARYAATEALDARLTNEKIVAYHVLSRGGVRFDMAVQGSPEVRDLWGVPGMLADDLGAEREAELLAAAPGAILGPWKRVSGPPASFRIRERVAPAAVTPEAVTRFVLHAPPNDPSVEAHLEWLLRSARVRVARSP